MWLKSDNHYQADTSLAVANLEHVADTGTVGLSWIRGLDVDQRYAQIMGLEHRDGMDTASLRGRGNLGVKDLELAAEYVTQDQTGGRENAWYLEGNWTFSQLPWSPTATYRYSRFSEGFDPLFYGLSRGYGTWFQGEVAANYAGPFNKNSQVHHVALKGKPRDNLTVGALYFDFDTLDTDQGNLGGRELDLYVEWMVNDHLLISGGGVLQAGAQCGQWRYAAGWAGYRDLPAVDCRDLFLIRQPGAASQPIATQGRSHRVDLLPRVGLVSNFLGAVQGCVVAVRATILLNF